MGSPSGGGCRSPPRSAFALLDSPALADELANRVTLDAPPPIEDQRRFGGAQPAELEPTAASRAIEPDLAALVTQFDCSQTLEIGFGHVACAIAIAGVHELRGRGEHTVIDRYQGRMFASEATESLRRAGLVHRLRFIGNSPELGLPELLRDGFETDFALIHGPKRFEDAFVEFLYLDRLLVTGGLIVFASAAERAVDAVLKFGLQARAYELRSAAGAELAVLQKLGGQSPHDALVPSRWRRSGDDNGRAPTSGTANGAGNVARVPRPANGAGGSSWSRELHLTRVRAAELEIRIAELGASLLEAEQRAADLVPAEHELRHVKQELQQSQGETRELRDRLSQAEAAHQRAEYWLACVNSSASWRATAPLRLLKRCARALGGH